MRINLYTNTAIGIDITTQRYSLPFDLPQKYEAWELPSYTETIILHILYSIEYL